MSVTIDHRLRMDVSHAEKQYRDVIDACQQVCNSDAPMNQPD